MVGSLKKRTIDVSCGQNRYARLPLVSPSLGNLCFATALTCGRRGRRGGMGNVNLPQFLKLPQLRLLFYP